MEARNFKSTYWFWLCFYILSLKYFNRNFQKDCLCDCGFSQYKLDRYGHHGFLAAEDSEETSGKIIYPFSKKQKSDKTQLNCGLPIPSLMLLITEEKKLQLFIPAKIWNQSHVFSEGSIWSELFPITELLVLPHHKVLLLSSFLCAVSSSWENPRSFCLRPLNSW